MADKSSPNQFDITGEGITVTYSTSSIGGQPQLNYQKGKQNLHFAGEQITVERTAVGVLVSVSIAKTVDRSYTTFSFALPGLAGSKSAKQSFRTIGITTVHSTTIAGPVKGASETYKVIAMRGTARTVETFTRAAGS